MRTSYGSVLIGGGLVLSNVSIAVAQSYHTVAASRVMQGEEALHVDVEFVVGTFTLVADARGALYRATLVYDDDEFSPDISYDAEERSLSIDVSGHGVASSIREFRNSKQRLDLGLAPSIPTTLALEFGAARADIDFGGLSLARASIETGASRSTVDFSTPNRIRCEALEFDVGAAQFTARNLGNARCARIGFSGGAGEVVLDFGGQWDPNVATEAFVEIGLGKVTLRFPKALGVTVSLDRLLAGFDRSGFVKRGDRYVSENFEEAQSKIHLRVEAVIGKIAVEWY